MERILTPIFSPLRSLLSGRSPFDSIEVNKCKNDEEYLNRKEEVTMTMMKSDGDDDDHNDDNNDKRYEIQYT